MNKIEIGFNRLLLASDLHSEFLPERLKQDYWKKQLPQPDPKAILILAGDIEVWRYGGRFKKNSPIMRLLSYLSASFAGVLYVPGNHEFYRGRADGSYEQKIKAWLQEDGLTNVFLMQKDALIINDSFRVLGATLWTDLDRGNPLFEMSLNSSFGSNGQSQYNDFNKIRFKHSEGRYPKLTPLEMKRLHLEARTFLEYHLSQSFHGQTWVITHHLPSRSLIAPKFKDHPLTPCYASNLESLFEGVDAWFFGHSHHALDRSIAIGAESGLTEMRAGSNPVGYPGENTGYEKEKSWL